MKLIEVKNVRLAYDGVTILDNLNFYVTQGDYFCIVGENGSGKSTLMRAILSLKPISGGEIGSLTQKFYDTLTGIQFGNVEDPFGWVLRID